MHATADPMPIPPSHTDTTAMEMTKESPTVSRASRPRLISARNSLELRLRTPSPQPPQARSAPEPLNAQLQAYSLLRFRSYFYSKPKTAHEVPEGVPKAAGMVFAAPEDDEGCIGGQKASGSQRNSDLDQRGQDARYRLQSADQGGADQRRLGRNEYGYADKLSSGEVERRMRSWDALKHRAERGKLVQADTTIGHGLDSLGW